MISRDEFRQLLKESVYEVIFTKTDGSERKMQCTLLPSFLPPIPTEIQPKKKKTVNPNSVSVWDIEKQEWRSFKIDSVIQYKRLNVVSN